MKIVKNNCFGGFGLSPIAQIEYLKRKGKNAFFYKQTKYKYKDDIAEYKKVTPEDVGMFYSTLTVDLGDIVDELKYKDGEYFSVYDIERTDPDLIAVIEELGENANGDCASLEVVEIPDGIDWEIDEYDGAETIREKHRTW